MNEQLGEAVLKLALDVANFSKGSKDVSQSLDSIVKRLDQVSNKFVGSNGFENANEKVGQAIVKNVKHFRDYENAILKVGQTAIGFTGGMQIYNIVEKIRQSLVGSVKDFTVYERGLKGISTIVDTTVVDMDNLEAGINKLSKKWGRGRDGLAGATYEAISANVAAGESLQFLDQAIETSVGGLTEAKTVVDGLTSVMNAYGLTVGDAESISDSFFVAVRDGKTRMEELAGSIGNVVPIAATLSVDFDTLNSAIAAITLSGQSTSEAVTGVRTMLMAILKPTKDAQETAKLLGIELDANAVKAKGFAAFLQEVKEKTGGSQIAMAKLFPDVQGLNAALQLVSESGGKNFNRILDDMAKKEGETARAADKMRDSLGFKFGELGNNFKNLGLDIINFLKTPIEATVDSFNGLFEIGQNQSLLSKFTSDRSKMSTEDLESFVAYNKFLIEETTFLASKNQQLGQIDQGRIDRAKNYIKVAQEEIELRKIEAGEASKALSYQKYMQDEKDKGAKKDEEAAKKAAEKRQKEVDDLIKNEEQRKKNQEIAQKNADLLNKLEADRLAVAERLSSIEYDRNSQILSDRKKAIEATAQYNKIAYDSQADNLERIVDDEKKSTAERLKANDELYQVKIDAAYSAKESELEALKLATEAEKLEQEKRIESLQNYLKELDAEYKKSVDDVKTSNLENKDEVLKTLKIENEARKQSVQFMISNSGQAFDQIETRGAMAARNIDIEFKSTLGGTYKTKVQTEVQLQLKDLFDSDSNSIFNGLIKQYNELKKALTTDKFGDGARREIERELKKVQMSIAVEISSLAKNTLKSSLDTLINATNATVEEMTSEVGDLISGIGDTTQNVYVKVAGEAIGIIGSISDAMNRSNDREYQNRKAQLKLIEDFNSGIDKTIAKTRDWLIQIGEIDTSNMSLVELKKQLETVYGKGASDLSGILGTDTLNAQDFKNIFELTSQNKDAFSLISDLQKGEGYLKTDQQIQNIKTLAYGKTYDEFISALTAEARQFNEDFKAGKVSGNEFINKYGLQYGLDFGGSNLTNDPITRENFASFQSLSNDQLASLFKISQEYDMRGLDASYYINGISDIAKQYSDTIKTTQGYISNYGTQTGIDPSHSRTKDDLLEDLQTMLDLGWISELEYYKQLYEYASGMLKTGTGSAFEWFSNVDRLLYKKKYDDLLNSGSSGIVGLADGGIALAPTLAAIAEKGKAEAVIPLEKLGSVMNSMYGGFQGGNIQVSLMIDPNIPITQSTAQALSEEFGQRIETVFRSRGL